MDVNRFTEFDRENMNWNVGRDRPRRTHLDQIGNNLKQSNLKRVCIERPDAYGQDERGFSKTVTIEGSYV